MYEWVKFKEILEFTDCIQIVEIGHISSASICSPEFLKSRLCSCLHNLI